MINFYFIYYKNVRKRDKRLLTSMLFRTYPSLRWPILGSYSGRETDTADVMLWTAKGQVRKPYLRRNLSSSAAVGGQFADHQASAGRTFNTVSKTPHQTVISYIKYTVVH